ncbi:MAG TPA: enoyl-CoA hydratase/isomerase family protein [Myxococcota bacterium]|nr:enoyl-CoA hydratase/isomerase family protein [Myxococcota bacterium]
MTTDNNTVKLNTADDVAFITLDAPPLNIFTAEMMRGINNAVEKVTADDSLKALVFQASGKAFSAGADVGEHHPDNATAMISAFGRMFTLLGALELPVVMAVDGAALGAGFELVMMADVLLASERATFGQPEIRLGFFAPFGVAYLPKLVGPARAMEITCSGRIYSAEQMNAYGLVSRVVKSDELDGVLDATLRDFRKASPLVMRLNVRTLKRLRTLPFEQAHQEAEKVFLEELMATEDVLEGIASFYEKRKPEWKNR